MLHAACQPAFDDVDDPEPAAPAVEITDVRVSVCERIEFASGSEDIPPIFMSAVDGVMRAIADNPDVKIQVEGHCDKGESPELAQARAQAVMRSLLSRGAKASQLRADGFGCACAAGTPVAGTGGRAARAARAAGEAAKGHNRRVTFSVIQEIKIDGSIQFGAMSASIGASSGPLLRQVSKVLEGRPHLHVMVEGHTCSAPSWGVSNLELSQQRAAAVVEHLVRAGIRAERLSSKGWGEQLPAFPHAHKARNRRVEFHIQARACEQGLRQLVASEARRRKLRDDPAAVKGFRDLAGARNGGGADALVRCAAADVLLALAVEWRIHRLLLLAVRKGRFSPKFPGQSCALALLDDDCCRLVMRHFFMS
jgi:outer membrane protein OmpA-like peptidoglycan-associated protein